MTAQVSKVPGKAWVVVFAGTAVNLCLGILYAWSVWSKALVDLERAGAPMTGINQGWTYLTNAQAATPFSLAVMIFALCMIPGGRIHDRFGPKFGAMVGGLFLAAGCILAGLMKSYTGLIIGFGIMGGIGMGIGYAAPTPAALKWFGPHKRGLIAGLVVGGYGGAAIYISPLGQWLIDHYGITGSFVGLGIFFAVVIVIAAQFLAWPPPGYTPPARAKAMSAKMTAATTGRDMKPTEIMKTWQFYALVVLFIGSTQSGLLIIANATGILNSTAKAIPFFAANAWILASYGGLVNAAGRVGTGLYSDILGRDRAYMLNCGISAACLAAMPAVIASQNVVLLFIVVGIAYWQYGGGLSLLPSFTADYYGARHLGVNYGLVFIGWGLGFFMARLAGTIKDVTGSLDLAFYISAGILVAMVVLAGVTKKPEAGK